MTHTFLRQQPGNSKLILIFGGWACDASMYKDVGVNGWDVLLCHEYDNLQFDRSLIDNYRTIYLYAWSLGVFAADRCLNGIRLARATAINGTLHPVDDTRGIPTTIFIGTANSLTTNNLLKFARRMFSNRETYDYYKHTFESRTDIKTLQDQLYLIADESHKETAPPIKWTNIIIGSDDRIFPPDNQKTAWADNPGIKVVSDGHYIDPAAIINATVVDVQRVGKLFQRSKKTYDNNAHIQRRIVSNLFCESLYIIFSNNVPQNNMLEIGYGTGLMTRRFKEFLHPKNLTMVDLCNPPDTPFGIAEEEHYVQADAEKWISNLPEDVKFDIIVSASTMQWFADPENFLHQCARHLSDRGVVCLSTFGPNNMCELNELRVSPIHYLSENELCSLSKRYFRNVRLCNLPDTLMFESPTELLRHLKDTGVTGGAVPSPASIRHILSDMKPYQGEGYFLTYDPIYIFASHNARVSF